MVQILFLAQKIGFEDIYPGKYFEGLSLFKKQCRYWIEIHHTQKILLESTENDTAVFWKENIGSEMFYFPNYFENLVVSMLAFEIILYPTLDPMPILSFVHQDKM